MSPRGGRRATILGSSAVMASGTVVSRFSGYLRNALLVAALGNGLHADVFNIANTVPNMLYILLAGGVFNAVLVPQLVRSMRRDSDGGEAYTNRIVTLALVFLAVVTLVLVVFAPLLMRLFLTDCYFTPELAAQRDSVIAFARYCLPQVFFYGMFVLLGQVLNSRGSFGPMMWAPIANNLVSVAILGLYLVVVGPAEGAELSAGFGPGAELLLGLGSTLGIAVQLLVLLPYMHRVGFRFRPRFDFRGTGLGHTLRLGVWTVLFVIVNQVAYTIVVRIASSGTLGGRSGCAAGGPGGTGYTVYSNAYLLVMVPHSIITVSLATAMLPRLSGHASDGDLRALGRVLAGTLRSTYAIVLPLLALVPVVALEAANLIFGYGAGAASYGNYVPTLSLFALGQFFFTTHYLALRGFYALEKNRRVFLIQCAVAVTNIVVAVLLARSGPPAQTAPRLVVAYAASYAVGAILTYLQLDRTVGGLATGRTVRFGIRAGAAVAVATGVAWLVHRELADRLTGGKVDALVVLLVVTAVDLVVYAVLASLLRVTEVTEVTSLLTRRLPWGRQQPPRRGGT